jgi:dipeptidyl aminopeptidase/acylaminoacyl peptidase
VTSTGGNWEALVWSPDGSEILGLFTPGALDWPRHGRVAAIDARSGEPRILTEPLDRNCSPYPALRPPVWDRDRILFVLEDRGNVHLYAVPADGSEAPQLVVGDEQLVTGFDSVDGTVVHCASRATTLSDLYAAGRQLTGIGTAFTQGRELGTPERFTAVSEDGTEVDAWILRPAGFQQGRRYPALLSIHGGPFSQYHTGFFDEFQVLAGAGYAVVWSNPRGSSGYGEAWGRAIRGPSNGEGPGWGTRDFEDLTAVVDAALERYDFVDPERLGVLGGSYGGFMTSWIVGHTDRFKAACSERAVNNLLSAHGSSDLFWAFAGAFGSYAFDEPETWLDRSPSSYAKDMATPLLILHSEDDLRCSIEQAEHLFVTLRLLGKQVEFVRFPAESHELTRSGSPIHRVTRFEILLDWFDRFLKDGQDAAEARAARAEPALRGAR